MFSKIENIIHEHITEASILPEFKVEFTIMPQTLQFDMLNDEQLKQIMELTTTMIKRIQDMMMTNNKPEFQYSMAYPFQTQTEKNKALVIIDICYRRDGAFDGKRISIQKCIDIEQLIPFSIYNKIIKYP